MRMQASVEFLLIASVVSVLCLTVVSLYSKNIFAQSHALAQLANFSEGTQQNNTQQNNTSFQSYSATIAQRNEQLVYPLSKPAYIVNVSEVNYCTRQGFFGHPYDLQDYCGTINAWDFAASVNYCPTTATFCVLPKNVSSFITNTSTTRNYSSDFMLVIDSTLGTMESHVRSDQSESPLLLGNKTIGHVKVLNVTSPEPYQSVSLFYSSGYYQIPNSSLYSQYLGEKGDAYAMLSFYNSSGVDAPTQQGLQYTVNAFVKSTNGLLRSSGTNPVCSVISRMYSCNATFPFSYLIDANISSSLGPVNQTLYYMGSVIRLESG